MKRLADLKAKIIGFNDEAKKLNEEEKAIMDSPAIKGRDREVVLIKAII